MWLIYEMSVQKCEENGFDFLEQIEMEKGLWFHDLFRAKDSMSNIYGLTQKYDEDLENLFY